MHTATPRPGRFEGSVSQRIAETVESVVLAGWSAEDDVFTGGAYAVVVGRLYVFLYETDDHGFVTVTWARGLSRVLADARKVRSLSMLAEPDTIAGVTLNERFTELRGYAAEWEGEEA